MKHLEHKKMPSKLFPCIETTLDTKIGEHDIRLWIDREDIPTSLEKEKSLVDDIKKLSVLPIDNFVESIKIIFPKVSAIQVREGEVGVVIYTTDFITSVHG